MTEIRYMTAATAGPDAVRLAAARQQIAADNAYLPTWDELTEEERDQSTVAAGWWLEAAKDAVLIAKPSAPVDPAAAHRVRIFAHKPWHAPEYDITHPAACDALPYGERCWLDELVRQYDDEMFDPRNDWPDKGRYVATAPAEGESAIRFEPIEEES